MKRIITKMSVLLLIAILPFLLIACGGNEESDEILNYVNVELVEILEKEQLVLDEYEAVRGDNYTDDETTYVAVRDVVIPASSELIELSEKLTFKSENLRNVHEIYLSYANTQHQAFTMILAAIGAQDYELITKANELLEEARKLSRDYVVELQALLDENGLVMEQD